jgi:hypothetical protein
MRGRKANDRCVPSPSSNRTCSCPHPAFAWRSCAKRSQLDQSQTVMKILIEADILR